MVSYLSIFLHEIAHLISAILIGLIPSKIIFFPFGVNLRLKNNIIGSLSDEIILYLSGPLFSAILALICLNIKNVDYARVFYYNNLGLFIFNILPILPMDGGIIANEMLTNRVGQRKSALILKILSASLVLILFLIQTYLIYKNNFNFTILLVSIFLIGNIFTNKEKYNLELNKQLMFYKKKNKKNIKKVKGYQIKFDTNYRELIKEFSHSNYYIIFKENKEGKISDILTEQEIIEEIIKK